jgi:hypothetical protein
MAGRLSLLPAQFYHRRSLLDLVWNAKVAVAHPQWRADLFLDEPAEGASVDPPDDLPDNPAEGSGVIAGLRSRFPEWRLSRNPGAHPLPIRTIGNSRSRWQLRHARSVGKRIAHRCPRFATGAKRWPVPGDWRVIVQRAALCQQMHAGRHNPLADRPHREQGVPIDRTSGRPLGHACPRIHDQFAVEIRRHLEPQLLSICDQFLQIHLDCVVSLSVHPVSFLATRVCPSRCWRVRHWRSVRSDEYPDSQSLLRECRLVASRALMHWQYGRQERRRCHSKKTRRWCAA